MDLYIAAIPPPVAEPDYHTLKNIPCFLCIAVHAST